MPVGWPIVVICLTRITIDCRNTLQESTMSKLMTVRSQFEIYAPRLRFLYCLRNNFYERTRKILRNARRLVYHSDEISLNTMRPRRSNSLVMLPQSQSFAHASITFTVARGSRRLFPSPLSRTKMCFSRWCLQNG